MNKIIFCLLAFFLVCCSSEGKRYKFKKYHTKAGSKTSKAWVKKNGKSLEAVELTDTDSADEYQLPSQSTYEGYYKIGNPYEIHGVAYEPQDYENYEEVGTASWYGDDFHGKKTANGEIYNMHDMTAAHPTLPLPSLIRVTNLRNGKKIIARVNDRGPFAKDRIVDVSQHAAAALGFKSQGTTEVKIELLKDDTDDLLKKLKIK
jgi:rare lipoprotein A (peptidoglycan hydrolase)